MNVQNQNPNGIPPYSNTPQMNPQQTPPPAPQEFQQPVFTQPPVKKPAAPLTKTERILLPVVLLLGLGFIRYVLMNSVGILTTVFFIVLTIASLMYIKKKNNTISNGILCGALFLGLFSTVFIFNTNSEICFWAALFLILGNAYLAFHCTNGVKGIERFLPYTLGFLLEYGFANIGLFFRSMRTERNPDGTKKKHAGLSKNILYIIIGLVIAFPMTLIVTALLVNADPQMKEVVGDIFSYILEHMSLLLIQLVLAVPAAMFLFSFLYTSATKYGIKPYSDERYSNEMKKLRFVPNMVIYASVTPISIIYIIFFFSQLSYFLSAFVGKTADGLIYSEYAREGFFELCFVAVINLFVLLFMNYTAQNYGEEKKPLALRIFSGFICLSTLVIITSALSKMYLYIDEYGLTTNRIYATWFMLVLGLIFIVILIHQFATGFAIIKPCFYVVVAMFTILCFARTDAMIVEYNINQYMAGNIEELDTDLLVYDLSDDAVAALIKYDDIIEEHSGSNKLQNKIRSRQSDYRDDYYEKLTLSGFMIAIQDVEKVTQ